MAVIFSTQNFIVEAADRPLVSREEGGHITITPVVRLADRLDLSPALATELMYLTILTGDAMTTALINRGIDIGRINYQDNGNWGVFTPEGPYLHYHLYGRAKDARIHKYGEACYFPLRQTGFYDNFIPLNDDDIREIQKVVSTLVMTDRYQSKTWGVPSITVSF